MRFQIKSRRTQTVLPHVTNYAMLVIASNYGRDGRLHDACEQHEK